MTPSWVRALARLLPSGWREDVLHDLEEETGRAGRRFVAAVSTTWSGFFP